MAMSFSFLQALLCVLRVCVVLLPKLSNSESFDIPTGVQHLRPEQHEQFVTRRCGQPTAVLFLGAPSQAAAEATQQLEATAGVMRGTACFGMLSCEDYAAFCTDSNIRRTPLVVLYPGRSGWAAKPHIGKIEKTKLLAALGSAIASQAQPIMFVKGQAVIAFLLEKAKPFKVLLVSAKKAPPVIYQALAGDPELVHHVRFGFVPNSDAETASVFNVSHAEIPQLLVQHMSNASAAERYSGGDNVSFVALRSWLRDAVRRRAAELSARSEAGRPLEGVSDSEAELSALAAKVRGDVLGPSEGDGAVFRKRGGHVQQIDVAHTEGACSVQSGLREHIVLGKLRSISLREDFGRMLLDPGARSGNTLSRVGLGGVHKNHIPWHCSLGRRRIKYILQGTAAVIEACAPVGVSRLITRLATQTIGCVMRWQREIAMTGVEIWRFGDFGRFSDGGSRPRPWPRPSAPGDLPTDAEKPKKPDRDRGNLPCPTRNMFFRRSSASPRPMQTEKYRLTPHEMGRPMGGLGRRSLVGGHAWKRRV